MKTKEKRFLGIFKKKTTPAPAAPPPPQDEPNSTAAAVSTTTGEETRTSFVDSASTLPEAVMPPRKGSIAQTSVIHYSPPGTVRASFPLSATSSVVSGGSDDSGTVVITRKSNIVLDDEESVISTPVSQYDESPIVQKPRTKRAAPPPPPPPTMPSPIASIPPMSPSPASKHFRQTSTNSTISSPPPPPPHRKQENEIDYEEMLKKLQNKFDEWNMVRLEDGGSIKEERIKAEMLKDHEKLKLLLEKQITSDRPKSSSSNNNNNSKMGNNNNYVKKQQSPVKIPQYGNFYAPPVSSPSPPSRVGAVPGGTVYQKVEKAQATSSTSSVPNGKSMSPRTDENLNEVKKKVSATAVQNTEAVDRLRREVEEQRQREREVKDYRNPKTLAVQVKSPEPKRKEVLVSPPSSPTKSGPRMVEYKPMKSPGLPIDPEGIYEEIEEKAPPIPNTPPPKLSEYRKEQQSTAPRMPTVPSNGYVRLQMNGAPKKPAPSAPIVSPNLQKIVQKPFSPPEFASSPKLLRKNPESATSPKMYASIPVKEEKKYEKPQVHPQMTNGNSGGMITATSSPSPQYRKSQGNPPIARGASVDQNRYEPSTKSPITNGTPKTTPPVTSSPVNYRKMVKAVAAAPMTRTVSEDQTNGGYAPKTTINITTSPYTQRRTPSPSKMSPMARTMSTDQTPVGSPSTFRKSSAPVTTSSYQRATTLRSVSTENSVPSPSTNRRSMPTAGILSATSSKSAVTSATSPPYPKGTNPTVISIKSAVPNAPKPSKPTTPHGETFDISDVLKGPKLRKVGMPVERSGISLGKVVDAEPSSTRPSSTPPPPPPPPPPGVLASPALQPLASKNPDLRDSLMSEIREAGRLRAARAAQSA